MANTNCLEGLQCPKCGSYEPFRIAVTVMVEMWDDGTRESWHGGDLDFDQNAYAECLAENCGWFGFVDAMSTTEYNK